MPSMESVEWAREQRATIIARRTELMAELVILNDLEATLVKLLPHKDLYSDELEIAVKPAAKAKAKVRKHKQGSVTPQVLKALEDGPMTIDELTAKLNRKVKTGVSSIVRFQSRKGIIIAVGDKYALAPKDNGVLVG